jgi:hypothetical protein
VPPVILFGAWDRHNFGDLLFPHIAQALLPGHETFVAGLAARDMRPHGGHEVQAITQVARAQAGQGAVLLHAGGEILTCGAWQAAAMLLPPEQLQPTLAYLERHPHERAAWVHEALGNADLAPYVAPRVTSLAALRTVYAGIGGVDLVRCEPAMRDEVLAKLKAAHAVREGCGHARCPEGGGHRRAFDARPRRDGGRAVRPAHPRTCRAGRGGPHPGAPSAGPSRGAVQRRVQR